MRLEGETKTTFRNEYHKAFLNVLFTNMVLVEKINPLYKTHDITFQQYNILRILRGQYPQTSSIQNIKRRMMDKNSDVSRIIERLYIKKLILREECKQDRRKKEVKISPSGLLLLKKMDAAEQKFDKTLLSNLSSKEVEQLNYLLDKIRD